MLSSNTFKLSYIMKRTEYFVSVYMTVVATEE